MKKILSVFLLTAAVIAVLTVPRVFAAVPVYDAANTAETHANFLQTAQQVINSATQIANQLLELKSLPDKDLNNYYNVLRGEFGKINVNANQAVGLMLQAQSVEQTWAQTFKRIDDFFTYNGTTNSTSIITQQQNMSTMTDKTLMDALRTAKTHSETDNDEVLLMQLLEQNKNAVGNKSAIQVQNELIAQQNALFVKQNQIMAAMATATIVQNAKQNQTEAIAAAIAKKHSDEAQAVMSINPFDRARKGKW